MAPDQASGMTTDAQFAGSIPALYEECQVPVLFEPFAEDLVARARAIAPSSVLEIAAGTGVVSYRLASDLPNARNVATDLNPAMLDVAARRGPPDNLTFKPADAQLLPFDDAEFELVVVQFGVMFFPDKVAAYREARRVLVPGEILLFIVWDSLQANPGSAAFHDAVRDAVPEPKPQFLSRTPFGYHDAAVIEQHLRDARFSEIRIERVERSSPPGSAAQVARGMCLGSPLANELSVHPAPIRDAALIAATEAAERAEAIGGRGMTALVVAAG